MKKRLSSIIVVLSALLFVGCVDTPDKEGWHSAQKSEFLDILKTDKYLSICNSSTLYEKILKDSNSVLMSRMLVEYAKNLANSCIDLKRFNALQKARNNVHFSSKFTTYLQKVNVKAIAMQLKAGQSIEQILSPYIPDYHQFSALLEQYHNLSENSDASEALLHKIRMSIERLKLMKPSLGDKYVLVNIPEFKVRVIEDNNTSISMRVITGRKNKQTPIFAAELKYIVLNPTWNVPNSIARHEIISRVIKDPSYLKRHRLVVRRDYNIASPAVTFNAEVAKAYIGGKGDVPFKFIEVASGRNALGRVKFIFPNENSVYMHDTPAKRLFKRKIRAYSHGCIRLGEPKKMLDFITTNYTSTPMKQVNKEYRSRKTNYVSVTKKLPIHTAYLTAYVKEDGKLYVFNDIYRYDKLQKLNFKE